MQGEQAKEGAGPAGPDQLTEVKGKVDAIGRLFDQLTEARTAARRTRLGVVLVILLVFLFYGFIGYRAIVSFKNERMPEFTGELSARFATVGTGALDDLVRIAQRVAPVYRDELKKQLQERGPEIKAAAIKQAEELAGSLADSSQAKIQEKLRTMAQRQKARVLEAFPNLKDEKTREIVMTNLETAFQNATMNVLEDRVKKGEERLQKVYDSILKFLPESDREGHQERMRKAWEQFLLWDMKGMEKAK